MGTEQELLNRVKAICRKTDVKIITPTAGQPRQSEADVVFMWNYETPAGTPFTVTRTKRR